MAEAVFGPTKLEAAGSICNCSPTHCQHAKAAPTLSLDIAENLERFTNLRVIFPQGPF